MALKVAHRLVLIAVLSTLLSTLAVLVAVGWGVSRHISYDSFEARFARSRPALEAYAPKAMASDPSKPLPALPPRLGEFQPGKVERLPHGFLFFCDYGHTLDANGLAYSTERLPATEPLPANANEHDFFEHITGNWYTVWRN